MNVPAPPDPQRSGPPSVLLGTILNRWQFRGSGGHASYSGTFPVQKLRRAPALPRRRTKCRLRHVSTGYTPRTERVKTLRDLSFIPLSDQRLRSWHDFWPNRGNLNQFVIIVQLRAWHFASSRAVLISLAIDDELLHYIF